MSGNPVATPQFTPEMGGRVPISPGALFIEEVYKSLVEGLFTENFIDDPTVTPEDFYSVLATGIIPVKILKYVQLLAPKKAPSYWIQLNSNLEKAQKHFSKMQDRHNDTTENHVTEDGDEPKIYTAKDFK